MGLIQRLIFRFSEVKKMNAQPFVPQGDSDAVKKLKAELNLDTVPMRIKAVPEPEAQELNCFEIIDDKVRRQGGHIRLGWAVWQHDDLYIEGEFHAVYDPGNGLPCVDCTPRVGSFREILFLPDPNATYDLASTDIIDNCRVPLNPDPRIKLALDYFSEEAALKNSVPGVNVIVPQDVARKIIACRMKASQLLSQVTRPQQRVPLLTPKVGRNDPCPCGTGKKYKRCHGR
jgi:hypothetical protein